MIEMKNIKSFNIKRARRHFRETWMENEDDASIISEELPILKENEFSFPYEDRKYAYVFGLKNFINITKESGDVRFVKPTKSGDVDQLVVVTKGHHTITFEKMKQKPLYVRDEDGNRTIIIAHPIKKRVRLVNNNNGAKFEDNLLSLFKNYENQLCVYCLLDRVDELLQNEWDKIHGNKKPKETYQDRIDKLFPKEYTRISYGNANAKNMKGEWDKLHGKRKDEYIV